MIQTKPKTVKSWNLVRQVGWAYQKSFHGTFNDPKRSWHEKLSYHGIFKISCIVSCAPFAYLRRIGMKNGFKNWIFFLFRRSVYSWYGSGVMKSAQYELELTTVKLQIPVLYWKFSHGKINKGVCEGQKLRHTGHIIWMKRVWQSRGVCFDHIA